MSAGLFLFKTLPFHGKKGGDFCGFAAKKKENKGRKEYGQGRLGAGEGKVRTSKSGALTPPLGIMSRYVEQEAKLRLRKMVNNRKLNESIK